MADDDTKIMTRKKDIRRLLIFRQGEKIRAIKSINEAGFFQIELMRTNRVELEKKLVIIINAIEVLRPIIEAQQRLTQTLSFTKVNTALVNELKVLEDLEKFVKVKGLFKILEKLQELDKKSSQTLDFMKEL
jgi:hypothetical protein